MDPEYVSEALPVQVAFLQAFAPGEHPTLMHVIATGPLSGELMRPAMATDTEAVFKVP